MIQFWATSLALAFAPVFYFLFRDKERSPTLRGPTVSLAVSVALVSVAVIGEGASVRSSIALNTGSRISLYLGLNYAVFVGSLVAFAEWHIRARKR